MSEETGFTSEDIQRWATQEINQVLKGLLRNLTEVRKQQSGRTGQGYAHQNGVVDGLNIAIAAVRRRIR